MTVFDSSRQDFIGGGGEESGSFGGGTADGDAPEAASQHVIATTALVDRGAPFEHRGLGDKGGDAGLYWQTSSAHPTALYNNDAPC